MLTTIVLAVSYLNTLAMSGPNDFSQNAEIMRSHVIQKCNFMLSMWVEVGYTMEGVARAHAAHREELQLHNFAAQLGHALEPINLSFLAQFVALRHEYFPPTEPQLPLPRLHIAPHRGFPNGMIRMLVAQTHPNPMSRVPLLAWRFYV